MNMDELLELRELIDQYQVQRSCVRCGACCLNFRTFFTTLEYERIAAKYGEEHFQRDEFGFPLMHGEERALFCPFLKNAEGARENVVSYFKSTAKEEGDFRDSLEECRCGIYDERPIVCRIYPTYPFSNRCTIGLIFQADVKDLNRYQYLLYTYNLQYRTDIIEPQTIDWENYRPEKSVGLVQISPTEITHWTKIFGYFQPFWSIWTFAIELLLDEGQQAVLERCDGEHRVPAIIDAVDIERDDVIEFLTSLILHRLIEPPEELNYPELNNLFYPTL